MTFTVQWTTPHGLISVSLPALAEAYQEAEQASKAGMKEVSIRFPDGRLIDWESFTNRSSEPRQS